MFHSHRYPKGSQMSNVTIKSVVPAFDNAAKSIIGGYRKFDKASASFAQTLSTSFQQHLDACAVAGVPRDAAGAKAVGAGMRECQVIVDAQAVGYIDKTFTEYVQGAMRAYFHNVPWTASLKNDPKFKIPAKDGSVKAGGSVTTTNKAAAMKTAAKLLQQLRILNELDAAAAVLDTLIDYFPDFAEPADADI